ncbi:hypothetical protein A7U60_g2180 [Sanghuangporus baumii]|uniref:Uncharacterized protein n=1 Tax=Sanghuangporus baumii TaxID=108892 RepID=A0A9Q5I2M9_SANBA|nr:hypothetical protein A7U60_g2180 [Sanghuangporus baumii]
MSGAGGTGSSLRPGYNDGSGSDPRFQSSSSTVGSRLTSGFVFLLLDPAFIASSPSSPSLSLLTIDALYQRRNRACDIGTVRQRGPIDVDVESHAHVHPLSSAASSSSATHHPPPALSAAPSANPGANTNNNPSSKQSQSRSRMPAIGAHPSFYDPDAPSHPQPALDYATFMMHQQQQQAHHHAHQDQMGYAQGQGEYGIDAGGYGGYEGLEGMVDVNVGFGSFAPQHQQHQQVYGHPSAHAPQQHALHQQHQHQLNSVSPASASTQSLPSGGGTPSAPPGAGSAGFFYEGYEHQGQPGQQQQFAHHGLPEQPFDVYFPPPSSSGAAGAGPGFDSFPSSAGTGTGTPPVPLWNSNVGEVSGIPETGQPHQMQGAGQMSQGGQRGQAQKDWSRSTGTEPPGRTGRRGTVRASLPPQQSPSTQQKQTQGQGPKQVHTPSSQGASARRKRTKRTRTADASDGSDDDSEDELGAGGPTSANPAQNPLFGTSFPSWTHGPPAGSFPAGGAGGAPWSGPSGIPTLANLVGGQSARL